MSFGCRQLETTVPPDVAAFVLSVELFFIIALGAW